jgi:hypothetical protein
MEPTKVFLSSTCYDLKQIRSDLFDFQISYGFTPIQSEYPNFPIDPDKNTIENCIENVKNNTDIFILVIGNRYGAQIDSGKSITNTEYNYAKEVGIPIYVFIYKPILTVLPIWNKNKNSDFSEFVDSTKIFDFIQSIRETDKKWTFEFETANDIVEILKLQFSMLFKEALETRRKLSLLHAEFHTKLSPSAINILLRKEDLFEISFFTQCLEDELHKFDDLKYDLDYDIRFASKENIDDIYKLVRWLETNITSLTNYSQSATDLINTAFNKFYGEPGVPSDIKGLYYVACRLAKTFQELLEWHNMILSTSVLPNFTELRNSFAQYTIDAALKIWDFPTLIRNEIKLGMKKKKEKKDEPVNINITLDIKIDQKAVENFKKEMNRLQNELS